MKYHYFAFALTALTLQPCLAQIEELDNTQMTQAYIEDGTIVVKQKRVAPKPAANNKRIKLSAGTPAVSQADQVRELTQQDESQYKSLDQDLANRSSVDQLEQFNQQQITSQMSIPDATSFAAQTQQAYAHDLVRSGLGLDSSTTVTTDLMVQYLSTFAGQTSGNPLGAQQSITANGIQISIPNPGGQIQTGIYPSADGNHSAEVTNGQIIWNLIFPQSP